VTDTASVRPSEAPRALVQLPMGPAAYTDEGAGAVILAVHGLPGSVRDFRWFAPHVSPHARIVRVDLPGFGETPVGTGPDPSPTGRARFVIAVADALGLERPVLLGHSMGGVVATAAVALAPDRFGALALVSSPGLRPHTMLRRLPVRPMRWLLERGGVGPALTPALRRLFAASGFRGYPDRELVRTLACVAETSIDAHAARVRGLSLPTLVAWCEDDPLIEVEICRELGAACPAGPRVVFAEGGHNPQKSHAEALARAILGWGPVVAE